MVMPWKRQPQEQEGTYFFSGKFLVTRTVYESLGEQEVPKLRDYLP